jgi:hypothetical protein
MKNDREPTSADRDNGVARWWTCMTLFGCVGILVAAVALHFSDESCKNDVAQQTHQWMQEQAEQLRRGEVDCLVNPDPAFIDELLADAACAAKVRNLYLGGDLSDPRLAELRKLPQLKCIVFIFCENHHGLLSQLRGMSSLEELTFDRTQLSRNDIAVLHEYPSLKSLSFDPYDLRPTDMKGLVGHPALERLAIRRVAADEELIQLVRSMPRLHQLSLGVCDEDFDKSSSSFENTLKRSLPHCKCSVWDDRR